MSSTTTLTWSNLLIVMSLAWQRPCAAEDGQLLAAGVRELHAQPEAERGGRHSRCGCGPRWGPSLKARLRLATAAIVQMKVETKPRKARQRRPRKVILHPVFCSQFCSQPEGKC